MFTEQWTFAPRAETGSNAARAQAGGRQFLRSWYAQLVGVRGWGIGVSIVLGLVAVAPSRAQVVLPPPVDRSVHDLAGVVSDEAVPRLEGFHRELFQKTGVAIVVVTVPMLDGEPVARAALRGAESGSGCPGPARDGADGVPVLSPSDAVPSADGVGDGARRPRWVSWRWFRRRRWFRGVRWGGFGGGGAGRGF